MENFHSPFFSRIRALINGLIFFYGIHEKMHNENKISVFVNVQISENGSFPFSFFRIPKTRIQKISILSLQIHWTWISPLHTCSQKWWYLIAMCWCKVASLVLLPIPHIPCYPLRLSSAQYSLAEIMWENALGGHPETLVKLTSSPWSCHWYWKDVAWKNNYQLGMRMQHLLQLWNRKNFMGEKMSWFAK